MNTSNDNSHGKLVSVKVSKKELRMIKNLKEKKAKEYASAPREKKLSAPKKAKKSKILDRNLSPYQLYDVRFDAGRKNSSNTNLFSNTISELKITEPEFYEPYIPIASYCVLEAYRNGFNTVGDVQNTAYGAYRQVFRVLHAYASNNYAQLPYKVPKWLANYGCAISPKIINTKGGSYDYSWLTNQNDNYGPPSFVPCNLPIGYETLIGYQPGTPEVNDFPTAIVSPVVITEDEGSFNALVTFMAQKSKAWEMVSPGEHVSAFGRDVSAFAQRVVTQGNSNFDGGAEYVAANEIPITLPAVTCAKNSSSPIFDGLRSTHCATSFAGSTACFPFLATNCNNNKGVFTRVAPVAAPIDFNEFVEVMALAVSKVQTIAAKSGVFQGTFDELQCPISLQEFKLVLRDQIMRQFSTSQYYGTTYNHDLPEDGSDRVFQPFMSGVSTCATPGMYEFLLPLEVVENIRALGMVEAQQGKKVIIYYPVLGQMNGDNISAADFNYTKEVDGGPALTNPSFATPTFAALKNGVKITSKDGSMVTLPESVIDPVDGASGSNYLFINDTKQLGKLAALWNGWFMSLATYWQKPTAFSVDAGLSVMRCVATSRFVVNTGVSIRDTAKRIETRVVSRQNKQYENLSDNYADYSSVSICASGPLFDYVQPILSRWVLPSYYSKNNGGAGNVTYVKVQGRTHQPFAAVTASTSGTSLSELHLAYASSIVKGTMGEDSEFINNLEKLSEKGRAGILSMLAGFLQGPLNSIAPGLGDAAKTVGDVIPI
jgi:hypothetical protein